MAADPKIVCRTPEALQFVAGGPRYTTVKDAQQARLQAWQRPAKAAQRASADRRQRSFVATATAPQGQQHDVQPELVDETQPSPSQLWDEVELLGRRAQSLENGGRLDDAADLLASSLRKLESRFGNALDLLPLRQLYWDLLFTLGRHGAAMEQAQACHAAAAAEFGADAPELALMSVRLGISTALAGAAEEGLRIIYDATPVLEQALAGMVQEAQVAGAAREGLAARARGEAAGDRVEAERQLTQLEAAASALSDNIDRVGAALGEGNFYGAVITVRHAAGMGQQAGVVRGWEELAAIVDASFGSLIAAADGVEGGGVLTTNALREHDSLARELSDDGLLGRLLQRQNERLHEIAEQGVQHPIFG